MTLHTNTVIKEDGVRLSPSIDSASECLQNSSSVLKGSRYEYHIWMRYLVVVLIYAVFFGVWQIEPVPLEVHALGIIIAAQCLFPLALWSARGSQGVPMFELICVAYLLAFGVPIYTQLNGIVIQSQFRDFSWEQTQQALQMAAIGITCLIFGHYVASFSVLVRAIPRLDLPLRRVARVQFIPAALVIGVGMFALNVMSPVDGEGAFGAIQRLLQNQLYIALVLLAYDVFRDPKGKPLWLYLVTVVAAGLGMMTGMLEGVLVPLLLVFLVRWHVRASLPSVWLAVGFVLLVVLNSVKQEFRQVAWYGNEQLNAGQKVGLWLSLGGQAAQEGVDGGRSTESDSDASKMLRGTLSRFDLLHQFVHMTDMTPQSIVYYDGETYKYFLYGWIPRFLWPDKPVELTNKRLAVDYKFVGKDDTGTIIGIGHLPEAYANFGLWGIVISMWLQGAVYALVSRVLDGPTSDGGRAIYLTIMISFLNGIGSSTSTLFMAILPNVVASAIILRFFATGWRAHRVQSKLTRSTPVRTLRKA